MISISATTFVGRIIIHPVETDNAIKTVLYVEEVSDSTKPEIRDKKVMAFLAKDSLSTQLQLGERIIFSGQLKQPSDPKNPDEFDYARFLSLSQIYYTIYLPGNKWNKLNDAYHFSLNSFAGNVRRYLMNSMQENGLSGREYAVTAAIILGYDELMDEELEKGFINAGAMHILCVSGLHVGIIYLVMNFILGLLLRKNSLRHVKAIVLLFIVWSYALLTGLSPSVQRASVMISVFIIGSTTNRDRDSYNTLAASAVLMLLYDPLLIFNVGFQLSYTAVLGILIFHRPIYNLLSLKNQILDKMWSVFVLSIAAQLGTFPLAIHYFHFFPTYFWLTNLFIFPLSFLIVATGFGFLLISWIPVISAIVGHVLAWLVMLLNNLIGLVEYLPYHGIDDLYFPWIVVFMVYSLILISLQVFIFRKIKYLMPLMIAVFLLVTFKFIDRLNVLSQKKIVISSIYKHSSIDFINAEQAVVLADTSLIVDHRKFSYHKKNSLISMQVEYDVRSIDTVINQASINFYYDGRYGYFGKTKFAILNGNTDLYNNKSNKVELDLLIITGKQRLSMDKINGCYTYDKLVIDGSVPYYRRKKIMEYCDKLGIEYYDALEEGAMVISACP